jgi:hypothetical protein
MYLAHNLTYADGVDFDVFGSIAHDCVGCQI